MDVIFMGSPEFAVPSLRKLADSEDFSISLVITQPPRKKGRKQKLSLTPVGKTAEALNLKLKPVEDINKKTHVADLIEIKPDYIVVVAFGQILGPKILSIPRLAPVNLHASLLPKYRGASPIQHAIINDDDITGVSTIYMVEELDAGDILQQYEVNIAEDDTAGSLHDKLAEKGSDLLVETLLEFSRGKITPVSQNEELASYTPKLSKEDGEINFNQPAVEIVNKIRGFNPWPGAFTFFRGERLNLLQASVASESNSNIEPGKVLCADKRAGLQISTSQNNLKLEKVQPAGSKKINAQDFINGYQPKPGEKFGR